MDFLQFFSPIKDEIIKTDEVFKQLLIKSSNLKNSRKQCKKLQEIISEKNAEISELKSREQNTEEQLKDASSKLTETEKENKLLKQHSETWEKKYNELFLEHDKITKELKEKNNENLKSVAKLQLECNRFKLELQKNKSHSENNSAKDSKSKQYKRIEDLKKELLLTRNEVEILKASHEVDINQLKKSHELEKHTLSKQNNKQSAVSKCTQTEWEDVYSLEEILTEMVSVPNLISPMSYEDDESVASGSVAWEEKDSACELKHLTGNVANGTDQTMKDSFIQTAASASKIQFGSNTDTNWTLEESSVQISEVLITETEDTVLREKIPTVSVINNSYQTLNDSFVLTAQRVGSEEEKDTISISRIQSACSMSEKEKDTTSRIKIAPICRLNKPVSREKCEENLSTTKNVPLSSLTDIVTKERNEILFGSKILPLTDSGNLNQAINDSPGEIVRVTDSGLKIRNVSVNNNIKTLEEEKDAASMSVIPLLTSLTNTIGEDEETSSGSKIVATTVSRYSDQASEGSFMKTISNINLDKKNVTSKQTIPNVSADNNTDQILKEFSTQIPETAAAKKKDKISGAKISRITRSSATNKVQINSYPQTTEIVHTGKEIAGSRSKISPLNTDSTNYILEDSFTQTVPSFEPKNSTSSVINGKDSILKNSCTQTIQTQNLRNSSKTNSIWRREEHTQSGVFKVDLVDNTEDSNQYKPKRKICPTRKVKLLKPLKSKLKLAKLFNNYLSDSDPFKNMLELLLSSRNTQEIGRNYIGCAANERFLHPCSCHHQYSCAVPCNYDSNYSNLHNCGMNLPRRSKITGRKSEYHSTVEIKGPIRHRKIGTGSRKSIQEVVVKKDKKINKKKQVRLKSSTKEAKRENDSSDDDAFRRDNLSSRKVSVASPVPSDSLVVVNRRSTNNGNILLNKYLDSLIVGAGHEDKNSIRSSESVGDSGIEIFFEKSCKSPVGLNDNSCLSSLERQLSKSVEDKNRTEITWQVQNKPGEKSTQNGDSSHNTFATELKCASIENMDGLSQGQIKIKTNSATDLCQEETSKGQNLQNRSSCSVDMDSSSFQGPEYTAEKTAPVQKQVRAVENNYYSKTVVINKKEQSSATASVMEHNIEDSSYTENIKHITKNSSLKRNLCSENNDCCKNHVSSKSVQDNSEENRKNSCTSLTEYEKRKIDIFGSDSDPDSVSAKSPVSALKLIISNENSKDNSAEKRKNSCISLIEYENQKRHIFGSYFDTDSDSDKSTESVLKPAIVVQRTEEKNLEQSGDLTLEGSELASAPASATLTKETEENKLEEDLELVNNKNDAGSNREAMQNNVIRKRKNSCMLSAVNHKKQKMENVGSEPETNCGFLDNSPGKSTKKGIDTLHSSTSRIESTKYLDESVKTVTSNQISLEEKNSSGKKMQKIDNFDSDSDINCGSFEGFATKSAEKSTSIVESYKNSMLDSINSVKKSSKTVTSQQNSLEAKCQTSSRVKNCSSDREITVSDLETESFCLESTISPATSTSLKTTVEEKTQNVNITKNNPKSLRSSTKNITSKRTNSSKSAGEKDIASASSGENSHCSLEESTLLVEQLVKNRKKAAQKFHSISNVPTGLEVERTNVVFKKPEKRFFTSQCPLSPDVVPPSQEVERTDVVFKKPEKGSFVSHCSLSPDVVPTSQEVERSNVVFKKSEKDSCHLSPDVENYVVTEPKIIPLETSKVQNIELGIAQKLVSDVATMDWDAGLMATVVNCLSKQEASFVARVIMEQAAKDFSQELDKTFTPPAPLMTVTQQKLLLLLCRLESSGLKDVKRTFLGYVERRLLCETRVEVVYPLTRMYVAICKLNYDLEGVRILCCNAAYYMGDLFIPLMFIVLTMWADILPLASEAEDIHLAAVLVQIIRSKSCKTPGYNVQNTNRLLTDYYGYVPSTITDDQLITKLIDLYIESCSSSVWTALVILCKNVPSARAFSQIKQHLMPLVDKNVNIPENSVLASKIVVLINRLLKIFNRAEDDKYSNEIRNWILEHTINKSTC